LAKVTVRWVTDLFHTLQIKVDELGTQLVPMNPLEVYAQRKSNVEWVIEVFQATLKDYNTLLADIVQTWYELAEHPQRVKVQAELEVVQ